MFVRGRRRTNNQRWERRAGRLRLAAAISNKPSISRPREGVRAIGNLGVIGQSTMPL